MNEFFYHYRFIARELYRVLMPGRNLSLHCMALPTSIQHHGYIGARDFPGKLIAAHEECVNCGKVRHSEMDDSHGCPIYEGLIYHGETTLWKDPVTAMQRTKAIGLLHRQVKKDSCLSRHGFADLFITMRKPGVNPEPVAGEFEIYIGADGTAPDPSVFGTRKSIEIWQRYASPVWMDINPSNTLQRESAREENDERHICPLQFQVIERGIELWTNPNDIVLSPFAGIGSEIYTAVKMGRRGIGIELKKSYYDQAVLNVRSAEKEAGQVGLFADQEVLQG